MFSRGLALCLSLALLPLVTVEAANTNQQQHAARPFMPGYRTFLTHHHGWHRVDYRVHAWVNIPVTDKNTANLVAKHYRSHGWTTQIVQPSKGIFVMKAKMHRWHLATYLRGHLRTAEAIAGLLRSQGYEARVVY